MRTRRGLAGIAAVAIVGAALGGCGGSDTPRSTTPGAPSSVSQSPSAPATLEPPVDGALPVPAYPASAIPWDQVGPGWFLMTYDVDDKDEYWPTTVEGDVKIGRLPELDESLMLVSPDGDLYYGRSLAGEGSGHVMTWSGAAIAFIDPSWIEGDCCLDAQGPLYELDLKSGARTTVNDNAAALGTGRILRPLSDGRLIVLDALRGAWAVEVRSASFAVTTDVCVIQGFSGSVSPDGTMVVCIVPGSGANADVVIHSIATGESVTVDTFKNIAWSYITRGWWDADSFVVTRVDDSGATLWWAYDVSTRTIRDLNAALSDGTPADFAAGIGSYRVVLAGDVAEVHGFDGSLRATLPCGPSTISGDVALAVCGDGKGPAEILVADLGTGEVATVASFDAHEWTQIEVYPYPGGASLCDRGPFDLQYGIHPEPTCHRPPTP